MGLQETGVQKSPYSVTLDRETQVIDDLTISIPNNMQEEISRRDGMNKPSKCEVKDGKAIAENARGALERVCSGKGLDSPSRYYSPEFVDHVNDMKLEGLEGARKSVELYTKMLSDLEIVVEEQLIDGDRVTSRFVVSGRSFGKGVRFNGITISRFKAGLIVEDRSVTDTLSMLRQLGAWRSVLLGVRQWITMKGW
jgi:predicted ester cyclase